ncbi:hypothetical protein SA2016_2282 [Sinomonas atrocyanea]|uniref:Uncharacterized protein n=2 Tax=Sinomonas atrocyanea TaxID=37927 RepID=A0A127A248_9MICC|nr:hypothetical protein SA2016_2282 [Sinomonas atrocyanea]GEB65662.1 hypothetical protein SAT01_31100 [Sinomonas atrocyanea]GGG75404.1 hypothetical protein GCM10007172_30290 [Sinomonas atrocyanea]
MPVHGDTVKRIHRTQGWMPLKGDTIELRQWGQTPRLGIAEMTMPDGSGFWLEPNGTETRLFVHLSSTDVQIWA